MKSVYKSAYVNSQILASSITGTVIEKRKATTQAKFDPKEFVTVGISDRDVELYKEIFDLFDSTGNGLLSPNDLRNALEMFGYHPKKGVVYQIISDIDTEEVGGITFKEFIKIMTDQTRPCDEDAEENYERVFSYFDPENRGYITRDDIQRVCMELNETLTDQELDDIMKKLDPEESQKCSFKSFHKNMLEAVMRKPKNR